MRSLNAFVVFNWVWTSWGPENVLLLQVHALLASAIVSLDLKEGTVSTL
jgi:hypothetical protein